MDKIKPPTGGNPQPSTGRDGTTRTNDGRSAGEKRAAVAAASAPQTSVNESPGPAVAEGPDPPYPVKSPRTGAPPPGALFAP